MSDKLEQRRQGAEMIIERCKQFADEMGVNLKSVEWKEDIADTRNAYTLIFRIEAETSEVQLGDTELDAYAAGTGTKGTDVKLKSIIKKRY